MDYRLRCVLVCCFFACVVMVVCTSGTCPQVLVSGSFGDTAGQSHQSKYAQTHIPLSHGPTNPGSNPGSTRVNAFTCAN